MASHPTPSERAADDPEASQQAQARRPRTRRRGRGSIQSYPTAAGKKWRYQIWVPVDPEQPDLGEKKFSRGGFATAADADAALQDALKKRDEQEKFGGKVSTLGAYAWVESLRLADNTIAGYKKLIRNHLRPQLGHYPLGKLTPTRIARHYRELGQHGRKDEQDKGGPLSAKTVHKTHVVLGPILDAAIEDGHIATNPAKRKAAKAPTTSQMRAEKPELVMWTADQFAAFLA